MKIVHFERENHNLGPPEGDGGRNVGDLPCRRVQIPWETRKGTIVGPATLSFWRPSARELRSLNEGKPIGLMICGPGHPPVTLFVDNDGAYAGGVREAAMETQEDPVAWAWPEVDRAWKERRAVKEIMDDALAAAAKTGEGEAS